MTRVVAKCCVAVWVFIPGMTSSPATPRPAMLSSPAPQLQAGSEEPSAPRQQAASGRTEGVTFKSVRISDGLLPDNKTWWKTFDLVSSSGNSLFVTSTPFSTTRGASKQYELYFTGARNIIRRTPELDDKGRVVGDRALGLFSGVKAVKPPYNVDHYSLFWRSGANFWVITGEHLQDVLALEARFRAEGITLLWSLPPAE